MILGTISVCNKQKKYPHNLIAIAEAMGNANIFCCVPFFWSGPGNALARILSCYKR